QIFDFVPAPDVSRPHAEGRPGSRRDRLDGGVDDIEAEDLLNTLFRPMQLIVRAKRCARAVARLLQIVDVSGVQESAAQENRQEDSIFHRRPPPTPVAAAKTCRT